MPNKPNTKQKDISHGAQAAAGLRALERIGEVWDLSLKEKQRLLGGVPRSTYYKWLKDPSPDLDDDKLDRLSYILGIYKALQILLPEGENATKWINRPNSAPLFWGRTAKEKMLEEGIAGLYEVRRYLDAQRGGWA